MQSIFVILVVGIYCKVNFDAAFDFFSLKHGEYIGELAIKIIL